MSYLWCRGRMVRQLSAKQFWRNPNASSNLVGTSLSTKVDNIDICGISIVVMRCLAMADRRVRFSYAARIAEMQ